MKLRKLEKQDARRMLEWMHNPQTTEHLKANFAAKKLEDCLAFIETAQTDPENLHLAVSDEEGKYLGTVSLKDINRQQKTAEFAITMHPDACGTGASQWGMREILRYGLQTEGLETIYWCVSPENKRAVAFYDHSGYERTKEVPSRFLNHYADGQPYIWYRYPAAHA